MKFEKERPERGSLAASQVMGSGLGYMATSLTCNQNSRSLDLASPLACAIADTALGMAVLDGPQGGRWVCHDVLS
jgi:hypothetical protein